jgi:hypothetical protein
MKAWNVFTLVGAMSVAPLLALPDQIGGIFIPDNINAQRLEDVALNQAVWDGEEKLVGQWEDLRSEESTKTFLLKEPALVFGVKADQVRTTREDGKLTAFYIGFRPVDGVAPTQDALATVLLTNIEVYTGASPEATGADKKGRRFTFGKFVISLAPGFADAIDVSITPAKPRASVATKD